VRIRLPTSLFPRYHQATYDTRRPLPAGALAELRHDNPRLLELREKYANAPHAMGQRSLWDSSYLGRDLDLAHFRGDNVYVWQFRHLRSFGALKYYVYLRYLGAMDHAQLLTRLTEDGLFGCWTFKFPGWPTVSRDLLDSINEIYFLERNFGLLSTPGLRILDVGAGYGRLAWRALEAAGHLGAYVCTDAVPESTFLCEYYLRFRGCNRAEVVPLHELERLRGRAFDVALNIHSFSEMSLRAIDAWVGLLAGLNVPALVVVPNDHDALLSTEADGQHLPFAPVLARHGYALAAKEPVVPPRLRRLTRMREHFFLFRR
jgi:SAM-dependent methyltransferase